MDWNIWIQFVQARLRSISFLIRFALQLFQGLGFKVKIRRRALSLASGGGKVSPKH